ncbi:MAG: MFS transporter [Desulfobacterales bacterium]|nr:MFS transporter [Desulfobacterales bacterium]
MRDFPAIPKSVWALGFVSMFMDISSEMIHSLLPIFLVSSLGAGAAVVGLIEGVSEAAALIIRAFSGALSDRLGRRKALAIAGYGLGALTKPLFALAGGVGLVFTARLLDRLGKGIRGAPRDALIADLTPPRIRGAAYGLRQSLDTVGAFLGPLLSMVLMLVTANSFRSVFWIAVVPGLLSVAILDFGVKEPAGSVIKTSNRTLQLRDITALSRAYWLVVAFGGVFTLARFSEAFLLLRAENVGMKLFSIPAILLVLNLVCALTAYPAGKLSDRIGRSGLMAAGLCVLIISDLVLAFAAGIWQVMAGAGLWGLHMGLTQGLLAAMVADTAPQNLRGTAFGVFSMVSGISILAASLIAGLLWDLYGAAMPFFAGAAFATITLLGFLMIRRRLKMAPLS